VVSGFESVEWCFCLSLGIPVAGCFWLAAVVADVVMLSLWFLVFVRRSNYLYFFSSVFCFVVAVVL
jgi:hypothetical protein